MSFDEYSKLKGTHAAFSASQPAWLNYDTEKAIQVYEGTKAKEMGIRLHSLAEEHINLGLKMGRSRTTFNMYVNDAIGFRMTPEVVLFYSDLFYGTADAISFKNNTLRIHDLKTGKGKIHPEQLAVYAALFCLQYGYKPGEIGTELRVYQNDDVQILDFQADDILPIMDKIVTLDKAIRKHEGLNK